MTTHETPQNAVMAARDDINLCIRDMAYAPLVGKIMMKHQEILRALLNKEIAE